MAMVRWYRPSASSPRRLRRELLRADGYYAKTDPAHLEASTWAGKGAETLGLSGPVDPDTFRAALEGQGSGWLAPGQA